MGRQGAVTDTITSGIGSEIRADAVIQVTSNTLTGGIQDTSMLDGHPHPDPDTEPWLTQSAWDDTQLAMDWANLDSSHLENSFASNVTSGQLLDAPSPISPLSPINENLLSNYTHFLSGTGPSQQKSDDSNLNNNKVKEASMALENRNGSPRIVGQLSQLSMRLCSLRDKCSIMVKFSGSHLDSKQRPLIHDAAFEPVAAWLTRSDEYVNTHMNEAFHNLDSKNPELLHPESGQKQRVPVGGQEILHEVFSASHHLLDTLQYLQIDNGSQQLSTFAANTPPADPSMQYKEFFGVGVLPPIGSTQPGVTRTQHCDFIIKHLVMACDTLLLEIYLAVLSALQRDAEPSAHRSRTMMGDVRLVTVVQLCTYFIERQCQAVDLHLASKTPITPPGGIPPKLDTADREVLLNLQGQIREILAQLRQTLQCTILK